MFNSVAEKIIPESPQFEKSPLEVSDTYVTNGNVGIEGSERDFSASRVRNINFFTSRIILLFGDKKNDMKHRGKLFRHQLTCWNLLESLS